MEVLAEIHPITQHGTPVLHAPCEPVTAFDEALVQLVADMFASMYEAEGVGLAANQIGVNARVFVVDCPNADGEDVVAHVVNPVLVLPPEPWEIDDEPEGCLSVAGGYYSPVSRPSTAVVEGVDVFGNPVRIEGTGLLARCLQHETDHLNGIVYVDRLDPERRAVVLEHYSRGVPIPGEQWDDPDSCDCDCGREH